MEEVDNKKKIVISVVVIVAIAILGFAASKFSDTKDSESTNTTTPATSQSASQPSTIQSNTSTSSATTTYKDGTYTSSGSYRSPGGTEKISVTVTVKDGTITESDVSQEANNRDSEQYQADFKQNYKSQVVGKKLSDIMLSTVSGSSLTSEGFNEALEAIKQQAV